MMFLNLLIVVYFYNDKIFLTELEFVFFNGTTLGKRFSKCYHVHSVRFMNM